MKTPLQQLHERLIVDCAAEDARQALIARQREEEEFESELRRWHPKPGDQVQRGVASGVPVRRFPKARAEVLSTLTRSGRYIIVAVRPARVKHFDKPKWCLIMGEGVLGWVLDFYLELDPEFLAPE